VTAVVRPPRPGAVRGARGSRHGLGARLETLGVTLLFVSALLGTIAVHQRLPWIPIAYLATLTASPFVGWLVMRRTAWRRRWRWSAEVAIDMTFVALLPVPWMRLELDHPPGTAWRLDGNLMINGVTVDPPAAWYWLTAGRPPIVAEVAVGWLGGHDAGATTMLGGRRAHRPAVAKPAAAAVGLRRAGWPVRVEATSRVEPW
jgi:hypothetical protein